MADQQDENTKELSRGELNVWNVEKWQTYLILTNASWQQKFSILPENYLFT